MYGAAMGGEPKSLSVFRHKRLKWWEKAAGGSFRFFQAVAPIGKAVEGFFFFT